jgi:hypothetical protein
VGQGILLTNTCCGGGISYLPGTRHTILAFDDGRRSEVAIVVEGSGGANTLGLFLLGNRGEQQIEREQPQLMLARSAVAVSAAPVSARPQL